MAKIFAIISLILVIVTAGCGFAIHFGGRNFADAINGHIVLGILSIVAAVILCLLIISNKGV